LRKLRCIGVKLLSLPEEPLGFIELSPLERPFRLIEEFPGLLALLFFGLRAAHGVVEHPARTLDLGGGGIQALGLVELPVSVRAIA
jgi:hypothetical protein